MAAKEDISAGTVSVVASLDQKVFTNRKGKCVLLFFWSLQLDCLRVLLSKGLNRGKHLEAEIDNCSFFTQSVNSL